MARRTLALVAAALVVMSAPGAGSATSEATAVPTLAPTTAPSPVCSATAAADSTATGIIITIDSPALGRIDGFELLADDGRTLIFDATELESRPEFPTAHLGEHQVLSDPILVTYHEDDHRLVVTRVDDAG